MNPIIIVAVILVILLLIIVFYLRKKSPSDALQQLEEAQQMLMKQAPEIQAGVPTPPIPPRQRIQPVNVPDERLDAMNAMVKDWGKIYTLLRKERKIEAIKEYRAITGASLMEAKFAIDTRAKQVAEWGAGVVPQQLDEHPVSNDQDEWLEAVQKLVQDRQKIYAIKLYREKTGLSLKEAKAAVDAIEAGEMPAKNTTPAIRPIPSSGLVDPDELRRLILDGRRIEAIRYYREATGVGLKEAKDAVDWLANSLGME